MTKGTILYVGGFELPDKNAAAHRVLSNGKALRALGYNVVFLGIDKSLRFGSEFSETKKDIQGFECWFSPYPRTHKDWFNYLTNIDCIKTIRTKYKDVQALIAYNYQAVALLRLKNYCVKEGIKLIADCTEWYSTKGSNLIFKMIKGLDSLVRMRILQKDLDGLIVISQYLEDYYKASTNVIRIPPLVDLDEEKWQATGRTTDDGKVRLLYAGSPGRSKDRLDLIINALSELGERVDYTFCVLGVTKEQYTRDYKYQKKILGVLGEKVTFLGRLSHAESINYLKQSDFSIFIRDNTRLTMAGFPTKFAESVSSGTPVITTRTSDLRSYLIEGKNGFFLDTGQLPSVSVIEKALNLEFEARQAMKMECIESRTFHYENYITQMGEFIGNVLS